MQDHYHHELGSLHCEGVSLEEIAAEAGTPCYVYSKASIVERYRAYDQALTAVPHTVCYAVKANSNLALLQVLAAEGAGFDIVSAGELHRVLAAGGDPAKVVFSGVGKTAGEMRYAIEHGIHTFNCESENELRQLSAVAVELGAEVSVALRVNPDVDAATHPYISTGLREHKFGIEIEAVEGVYEAARALPGLQVNGVSCHIGSQLLKHDPLMEAVERMLALVERLRARGFDIRHFDMGGGLGVAYKPDDRTPAIAGYARELAEHVASHGLHLMVEPGRSVVAAAGVLLSRVIYRKETGAKTFLIVDAAMNDLLRPSLYQAHHEIVPVRDTAGRAQMKADVVGPVCETGDFLARDRDLPLLEEGELIAIRTAGAYGFVLSSNYNSRTRVAEVMVDGSRWQIVRERESLADLIRGERLLESRPQGEAARA